MWGKILGLNSAEKKRLKDFVQFIIIGKGGEQYSLETMGQGELGVVDMTDPNDLFLILNHLTVNNLLDAGGAIVAQKDQPRTIFFQSDPHGTELSRSSKYTYRFKVIRFNNGSFALQEF